MRLFHLVQKDDAVRLAAHRLGQNAALAVADIAGRRAHQQRDFVLLLELGHVDDGHVLLAAVKGVGQSQPGFGLADAAGADQKEDTDGTAGIGHAGARRDDGLGNAIKRMRLPDDPFFEPVLQVQDRVDLVRDHAADRDSGPRGNHFRDRLIVDENPHQSFVALKLLERLGMRGQLFLQPRAVFFAQRRIGLGALGVRRLLFGDLAFIGLGDLPFSRRCSVRLFGHYDRRRAIGIAFESGAAGIDLLDKLFFLLPPDLERLQSALGRGLFFTQFGEPFCMFLAPAGLLLALEDSDRRHQLTDVAPGVFDRRRSCAAADSDPGAGRIQQTDRFVRKLASGNIAVR